jgi:hypothetical protein
MEPVKLKLYGFLTLTRRRYVGQLVFALLVEVALLGLWWLRWPAERERLAKNPAPPVSDWLRAGGEVLPWVLLGVTAAQVVEAVVVLRRFARKEAARRPQAAPSPP